MFSLTRQERRVILFLISIALIGAGINNLAKRYGPVKAMDNLYEDVFKIDLNSAEKEVLTSISGIGDKLAQRIIDYRENQKGFRELEELKNIKGISEQKLEKIKDYLVIK